MRFLASVVLVTALIACQQPAPVQAPNHEPAFLTPFGEPTYPFSPAVRVGHILYLSGEIGVDSAGTLVPGGIGPETKQTMENIKRTLAATGSSLERVVKCTVMMADMKEWPAMNEVYKTYFPDAKPARSAFGSTALALGARVEIECIAVAKPI